ncbi:hypothetical protein ABPG77_001811 [Micractinium sp. CCAP 211/92]
MQRNVERVPDLEGAGKFLNLSVARRQRCAIFNGVNFHLDVTAGLAWAFQEAGCDTNVYMHPSAHGLQEIIKGWLRGRLLPRERMEADQPQARGAACQPGPIKRLAACRGRSLAFCLSMGRHFELRLNQGLRLAAYARLPAPDSCHVQYDVLIMVTFPEGPGYQERQNRLLLSRPPHQRILLGVHNPGWLLDNAGQLAPPLLLSQAMPHAGARPGQPPAAPPVQLLSLAPIGATYTKALLRSWLSDMQRWMPGLAHVQPRLEVPWIAPLVPWAPSDAGQRSSNSVDAGGSSSRSSGGSIDKAKAGYAGQLQHLCIQGTIHPKRRDYQSALAAASHPAVLAQLWARNESLLLVGISKELPQVPAELRPFVQVLSSLSYSVRR